MTRISANLVENLSNKSRCFRSCYKRENYKGNIHAWKACIPLKGIGGSNPPLSAK